MNKIRLNLYELLLCLTNAQDYVHSELSGHQEQVAYLSYRIAEEMKMPLSEIKEIILAGILHDIGALSTSERINLIEDEPFGVNNHGFKGAKIISGFRYMHSISEIIKYHHLCWNGGEGLKYRGKSVPLASHIIHIADRVCVKIDKSKNILSQINDILANISEKKGTNYSPEMVDALNNLKYKEYIWLDLVSDCRLQNISPEFFEVIPLEINDIVELALIFSFIIDFRSEFTANHSAGVAKTAEKLAFLAGFSPYECKMMLIAGYLHDLGKLAISNDILEKNAKLNNEEFNEIRSHTYYTYHMLNKISALKTINQWASFHHEKLNGKGYPFHLNDDDLSLGSKIMAVADVFTAITEDRPYREGLDKISVTNILNNMVNSGGLHSMVVKLLLDNYDVINDIRKKAQAESAKFYANFLIEDIK